MDFGGDNPQVKRSIALLLLSLVVLKPLRVARRRILSSLLA